MLPISADEHLQLFCAIALVVAVAVRLEKRLFGGALSGAVYALLGGLLISNLRLVPFAAPVYDFVTGYLLIMAIPLLLARANIREVVKEGGVVLKAFLVGAIGTLAGAALAVAVVDLGQAEAKLAGMFTGTFIGGSVNFVSVSEVVELNDPSLFAAAVASDVVVGTAALLFLIGAPSIAILQRYFGYTKATRAAVSMAKGGAAANEVTLPGIALSIAVALTICVLGSLFAALVGTPSMTILFITLFILIFSNLFPRIVHQMRGDADFGLLMMYLFFVVIGIQSDMATIAEHGMGIVGFTAIVVAMHFLFVLVGGRLLGMRLPEVLIGSSACVTGPAPALAQAVSEGWEELKAPAVLVGVFGYSIGTFLGVTVTKLLS